MLVFLQDEGIKIVLIVKLSDLVLSIKINVSVIEPLLMSDFREEFVLSLSFSW